jgi:hypothetical protein
MISLDESLINSSGVDPTNPFVDYALPEGFPAQSAGCIALPPLVCPPFELAVPEPSGWEPGFDGQADGSDALASPPTGGADPLIDGGTSDSPVDSGFGSLNPDPGSIEDVPLAITMAMGEEGEGVDVVIHNCWLPPYLPFPDTTELPIATTMAIGEESGDVFDGSSIGLEGKPAGDGVDPWLQNWFDQPDFSAFEDGVSSELDPAPEPEAGPEDSPHFVSGVPLTDFALDGFDLTEVGSVGDQIDINLELDPDSFLDPGSYSTEDIHLETTVEQAPVFYFQPFACVLYVETSFIYPEISFIDSYIPFENDFAGGEGPSGSGDELTEPSPSESSTDTFDTGDVLPQEDVTDQLSELFPVPEEIVFTTMAVGEESGDGWVDPWEPLEPLIEVDPFLPFLPSGSGDDESGEPPSVPSDEASSEIDSSGWVDQSSTDGFVDEGGTANTEPVPADSTDEPFDEGSEFLIDPYVPADIEYPEFIDDYYGYPGYPEYFEYVEYIDPSEHFPELQYENVYFYDDYYRPKFEYEYIDFNLVLHKKPPVAIACYDQFEFLPPVEDFTPDPTLLDSTLEFYPVFEEDNPGDTSEVSVEISLELPSVDDPPSVDSGSEGFDEFGSLPMDPDQIVDEWINGSPSFGSITTKAYGEESGGGNFFRGDVICDKKLLDDTESPFLIDSLQLESDFVVTDEFITADGEEDQSGSQSSDGDSPPIIGRGQDPDGVIRPWYRTLVYAAVEDFHSEPAEHSEQDGLAFEADAPSGLVVLWVENEATESSTDFTLDFSTVPSLGCIQFSSSSEVLLDEFDSGSTLTSLSIAAPATAGLSTNPEAGSILPASADQVSDDPSQPEDAPELTAGPHDAETTTVADRALPVANTAEDVPSGSSGDTDQPSPTPEEQAANPISLLLQDSGGIAPNPLESFDLPLLTSNS